MGRRDPCSAEKGEAVEVRKAGVSGFVEQRSHATPLAQQTQSLRELHVAIDLGEANHIAAAATAVTVEEILTGVHYEARLAILVKRA